MTTALFVLRLVSALVLFGYLLNVASVMPHDQKHGRKLVIMALAIGLGVWVTEYGAGPLVLLDVLLALALLYWRRPVWAWTQRVFGRRPPIPPLFDFWLDTLPMRPLQPPSAARHVVGGSRRN